MNLYFLFAGILCFVLGIVHSLLGEYLIFNRKRKTGNLVPTKVTADLKERHLRIIWATWHLSSLFGWCIGAILTKIALNPTNIGAEFIYFTINTIGYTMLTSSLLVLIGTRGKHPGWVVLLTIGVLVLMGN